MIHVILKFAALCRTSGLKVSTSEVLDTMGHMKLVDPLDESQFRMVLSANFVKTHRDQSHFDKLYTLYFHNLQADAVSVDPDGAESDLKQDILEGLKPSADAEADPLLDALLGFLGGDPLEYLHHLQQLEQLEQGSQAMKSNMGGVAGRLAVMLKANETRSRIAQLLNDPQSQSGCRSSQVRAYFENRLDMAVGMLAEENRPDNKSLKKTQKLQAPGQSLGDKSFASLSPKEIEEMRTVVKQLVRKLKDMVGRRWAKQHRGVLDVKRTLRSAGRFQGIPLDLVYKSKPPRKSRIVTLCDISGSVWSTARFMLNLLYSMQDCFSKVRSFVFVADLAEVTPIFEKYEIDKAMDRVMNDIDINLQALTDYGETLVQFRRNHMEALTPKTTLIIVGDGRSNYFSPQEHILAEMRERCRRIIWLNPEPEPFWKNGDSEMHTYMRYCHEVRLCQNLNQLTDFVQELVL